MAAATRRALHYWSQQGFRAKRAASRFRHRTRLHSRWGCSQHALSVAGLHDRKSGLGVLLASPRASKGMCSLFCEFVRVVVFLELCILVFIAQAQHLNHLNWPFQPVGTVAQGQGPDWRRESVASTVTSPVRGVDPAAAPKEKEEAGRGGRKAPSCQCHTSCFAARGISCLQEADLDDS